MNLGIAADLSAALTILIFLQTSKSTLTLPTCDDGLLNCTLQATTMLAWDPLEQAAVATLFLVVLGVMVVTTMATLPMEEASTQATSAVMVALRQATTAMVAVEALLLAVSSDLFSNGMSYVSFDFEGQIYSIPLLEWQLCLIFTALK